LNIPFLFLSDGGCVAEDFFVVSGVVGIISGCGDVGSLVELHDDPSSHCCISHFGKTPVLPVGQTGVGLSQSGYVPEYPGGQGGKKQFGMNPTVGRRHLLSFTQSGNVPL